MRDVAVSLGLSLTRSIKQSLVFRVSERSCRFASPALPAEPVAPILEPACGNAVQVQQVGGVAPAVVTSGMATVQAPVGHDGFGRHDVAGAERRTELLEHSGDVGRQWG